MLLEERSVQAIRVSRVGLAGNILLTLAKYLAGFLGHSSAMIADATHSLSDIVTDVIVLAGMKVAHLPADKSHDYGHGKFETLMALICGISLVLVAFGIFWSGLTKTLSVLSGGVIPAPGKIALFAAILSIATKEWMYRYTFTAGKRLRSPALMANAWHHRSDVFSSLGTLVGVGGAVFLSERWRVLDPLAALGVSFFIIKVAIPIVYDSVNEFLEASLSPGMEEDIVTLICDVDGVLGYHELRTRRIGPDIAIEMHIQVDPDLSISQAHDIATEVEENLRMEHGPGTHVSVHVEPLKSKGVSRFCSPGASMRKGLSPERRDTMAHYSLSVPDISCHHCVARISQALEEAGVPEYRVLLEEKIVEVETDDLEKVIAVLDEAGYDATLKA